MIERHIKKISLDTANVIANVNPLLWKATKRGGSNSDTAAVGFASRLVNFFSTQVRFHLFCLYLWNGIERLKFRLGSGGVRPLEMCSGW